MRSISKAMIAVMIAAAMCAVPLFIAEDSEAIDITVGGAGISFETGSISDADFAKLTGGDAKEYTYSDYADSVLSAVIADEGYFQVTASSVKITNVKDVKLAKGTDVKEDSYAITNAQKMTFDVEFKAVATSSGDLFPLYDGTQTLYKELGKTNAFAASNTLEFKGTATISEMSTSEYKIAKTYSDYYVATEGKLKMSHFVSFSGDVTFNNGTTYKITVDKAEAGVSSESSFKNDFYGVETSALTSESKYMRTSDGASSMFNVFKYKINDKSDGYDWNINTSDLPSAIAGRDTYVVGTVGSLSSSQLITTSLVAPTYLYYDGSLFPSYSTCFFTEDTVSDASLKDNTKMKEFLESIGSVGDTYSSAESTANGSYESVGSSGGNNNIVFYVIIGVLAVAVVALAVLMIKKK